MLQSTDLEQNCFASKANSTASEQTDLGPHILLCLRFLIRKMGIIMIPILCYQESR